MQNNKIISLDVGERRIGVAIGDRQVRIASPLVTIDVDGREIEVIKQITASNDVDLVVVGYPRNQSGEITQQTRFVEKFADQLRELSVKVVFQDESLTSVLAEQMLDGYGKPYSKSDIDAQAATLILQDYLDGLS